MVFMVPEATLEALWNMHQLMNESPILRINWIIVKQLMDNLNNIAWLHSNRLLPNPTKPMNTSNSSLGLTSSTTDTVDLPWLDVVESEDVYDLVDSFLHIWCGVIFDHSE